jgi:glycosyltransferase involved in cell wall biosynthesis
VDRPATWWAQGNPTTRHVRCEHPAKVLGGQVRSPDMVGWAGLDLVEVNEGVAIWQILCNFARLGMARRLLNNGVPVYAEVDDDYTRWDETVANSQWTAGMPDPGHPMQQYQASVELHRRASGLVEGIICATPRLADVYSELNPNVAVCPNSVDPDEWADPVERDETFRIIWMASASHRVDQRIIGKALEWAAKQPGVEVTVVGSAIQHLNLNRIPWMDSLDDYRRVMVEIAPDVGVCPLRDTAFSRGKSDLKALEYSMAGAMPVISKLEPYEPWQPLVGDACLEAQSVDEWFEVIRWTVENQDEVREMGRRARAHVLANRTIQATRQAWADAIAVPVHELALA